ncbi:hypothetical protein C5167_001332 [Papaver somniferum]|uniref:Uncharacterized protein n=1 Tax=Papaver somniferum TaxID=3469 RepID=A0A4Y7KYX1_PAPSO|nr:hypothetical protein C5167_001332 [Papaver somniferum]
MTLVRRSSFKGDGPLHKKNMMYSMLRELGSQTQMDKAKGGLHINLEQSDNNSINWMLPTCELCGGGAGGQVTCMTSHVVCTGIFNKIMSHARITTALLGYLRYVLVVWDYDVFCNWLGNSRSVHAMKWSVVDGAEKGQLISSGPLSFLKVHDAGQMVPMDQPKATLEMLRRWTHGKLLVGAESDDGVATDLSRELNVGHEMVQSAIVSSTVPFVVDELGENMQQLRLHRELDNVPGYDISV